MPEPRDNSAASVVTLRERSSEVGVDIVPGRYVITPGKGESGIIGITAVNGDYGGTEGLGDEGVPNVTTDLYEGDLVFIRTEGLSITLTPVETRLSNTLGAGWWVVGLDMPEGRYNVSRRGADPAYVAVLTPYGDETRVLGMEVLGGPYGVHTFLCSVTNGDRISIMGSDTVIFAPSR